MGTQVAFSNDAKRSDEILGGLRWRYAVKTYDAARKITEEQLGVLEESILLAPSSFGIQPYKVFVISDPEVRERLKPAAYNQPAITDASHLFVFAYKKTLTEGDLENFVDRIAEVRGQDRGELSGLEASVKGAAQRSIESGSIETWNSRQAYIGLGFLLETAALLGIDATPMEGFDPQKVDEVLGLKDHTAVVIAAVGYRDADKDWLAPLPKVRKPKHELIERV